LRAWAVVPAKGFARAKTRLEPALDGASRAELARSMLEHVLDVLGGCAEIAGITVVTDDDEVEALARQRGASCVRDAGEPPLRLAVEAGLTSVRQAGRSAILVLMADLPLVRPEDVRALLSALDGSDVVIAPDAHGSGTNAIAFAPEVVMATEFGSGDSFAAHRRRANEQGLRLRVHVGPGTAYDVDLPSDLLAVGKLKPGASWREDARSGTAHRA
jgi:2-phospho-L-lactate guanylyltransferase